jgi:sugar/nucleoside kinase (ribokinase family)
MPVTVVGSIAFDAVKAPTGERKKMLGGAAVHFALAASFFDDVRVVGPVGDDFGPTELAVLEARKVDVADIEHIPGGRTFFWRGEYSDDFNTRETLETQLNVFEHFQPKLSDASLASDVLFLANIQPDLQRQVRDQCDAARFVALDSMNLWIDIARDSLVKTIATVDCLILNDEELRQLTGKAKMVGAAREVLSWGGPTVIIAKLGEYGAALVTADDYFQMPAFPLESIVDPTGAGDTFAGGFVGYIAAHPGEELSQGMLRRAMAYGTALASFNVEDFGTERVSRLTAVEISGRVRELEAIMHLRDTPIALRD